jgi:hypothetical protein
MNYFPYIFIAYILAGVVFVSMRSRSILEMDGIRKVLEETTMTPAMSATLPNLRISEGQVGEGSA